MARPLREGSIPTPTIDASEILLGETTLMPTEKSEIEALRKFYDEVYYKDLNKPARASRHLKKLATKLGISKDQKVLDVACGLGEWLQICAQRGAYPFGVDLSERAIAYCRRHIPNGEFYAQGAETLPFPDKEFDVVTCLGSLEHFVSPVAALKEMGRVAKSDAQFLILVPNADFLTRKLRLYHGTHQKHAKEVVRTLGEWQLLFEQAGLTINDRWRDLHVLSWNWIGMQGPLKAPIRAAQALALAVWPLKWQYQVYHLCQTRNQ
jgi:ubiquinone/menaquinone biosynthesis C-methylase UbiE